MNKLVAAWFLLSSGLACLAQVNSSDLGSTTAPPPNPDLVLAVSLSGTNAIPANTSLCGGSGKFTLTGNVLSYDVGLPFPNLAPTSGGIYGPAGSGTNADVIFAWTNYSIVPGSPNSTFKGAWQYKGTCTLTSDQLDQLRAGLWYVNVSSAEFPDGELRGQITISAASPTADGTAPPVIVPDLVNAQNSTGAQDRVVPKQLPASK